jgi:hypothetical protein
MDVTALTGSTNASHMNGEAFAVARKSLRQTGAHHFALDRAKMMVANPTPLALAATPWSGVIW